jgi:hypothetical protein
VLLLPAGVLQALAGPCLAGGVDGFVVVNAMATQLVGAGFYYPDANIPLRVACHPRESPT